MSLCQAYLMFFSGLGKGSRGLGKKSTEAECPPYSLFLSGPSTPQPLLATLSSALHRVCCVLW